MGVLICADNYLDPSVLNAQTYSTQETNFPATNLTEEKRRSKVWRSTSDSAQWIKWDLGISSTPKAFFAVGRKSIPIALTTGATIKLQGNSTDSWGAPEYEETIAYNENILQIIDTAGLHTSALRWWRLYIDDASNPNGYLELGFCYLGDALVTTQGQVQFPLGVTLIDNSNTVYSLSGASFSEPRPYTEALSLEWNYLNKTEKESIDSVFATVQTYSPFFIALDPSAVIGSDATIYSRYVKFASSPSFSYFRPGLFSCSMVLREEI